MKKNELKSYESVFAGFNFANISDMWMAVTVVEWLKKAHEHTPGDGAFRPPLVVVDGPRGCGKTNLVLRLVEFATGSENRVVGTQGSHGVALGAELGLVGAERFPAVLLDQYPVKKDSGILVRWLGANKSYWRRAGSTEEMSAELACVTFLTPDGGSIQPDLAKMAVYIHLLARGGVEEGLTKLGERLVNNQRGRGMRK